MVSTTDREKAKRQRNYIDLLSALQQVSVVLGEYHLRPLRCTWCGLEPAVCDCCHKPLLKPQEKQTDVNIAVAAMRLLLLDRCDDLIVVSSDSDLAPLGKVVAIEPALRGRNVYFVAPLGQILNKALTDNCSGYWAITERMLVKSQMRRVVQTSQRRFTCPPAWREGGKVPDGVSYPEGKRHPA
jgi:uncharacterized LabA/DUF88 family protein